VVVAILIRRSEELKVPISSHRRSAASRGSVLLCPTHVCPHQIGTRTPSIDERILIPLFISLTNNFLDFDHWRLNSAFTMSVKLRHQVIQVYKGEWSKANPSQG
jgi:hypothetical protein